MFSKESKYLEHELGVARKDVSAWAARPLSFESEGKANLERARTEVLKTGGLLLPSTSMAALEAQHAPAYELPGSTGAVAPAFSVLVNTGHFCTKRGQACVRCSLCHAPAASGKAPREVRESDFAELGANASAYFKLLKLLALTYLVLAALAAPLVVINLNGGNDSSTAANLLASTTLGNVAGVNGTNVLQLPVVGQVRIGSASLFYALLDLLVVAVATAAYFWAKDFAAREAKQVSRLSKTLQDYAVYLPNVAPGTTERSVRAWVQRVVAKEVGEARGERVSGALDLYAVVAAINAAQAANGVEETRALVVPEGSLDEVAEAAFAVHSVAVVPCHGVLQAALAAVGSLKAAEVSYVGAVQASLLSSALNTDQGMAARLQRLLAPTQEKQAKELAALRAAILDKGQDLDAIVVEKVAGKDPAAVFPSTGALVCFEHEAARDAFLAVAKSRVGWLQPCLYPHFALNGRPVAAEAPPSPAQLLYFNLRYSAPQRQCKRVVSNCAALLVIVVSFLIILVTSITDQGFQRLLVPTDCSVRTYSTFVKAFNSRKTPTDEAQFLKGFANTNPLMYCVCDTRPWSTLPAADLLSSPYTPKCTYQSCPRMKKLALASLSSSLPECAQLAAYSEQALGFSLIKSLVVFLVNDFLSWSIRALSYSEGHHTQVDQEVSVTLRVFATKVFNTLVLTVLINMNLPLGLPTGLYSDFTPGWYAAVGSSFIQQMFLAALVPHIPKAIALLQAAQSWRNAKLYLGNLNQPTLVRRLQGPVMDFSTRAAEVFVVLYVTLVFMASMPLMAAAGLVALVAGYWADKFFLTRLHRRPPFASSALIESVVEYMPLAILVHLGVGVWTVSDMQLLDTTNPPIEPFSAGAGAASRNATLTARDLLAGGSGAAAAHAAAAGARMSPLSLWRALLALAVAPFSSETGSSISSSSSSSSSSSNGVAPLEAPHYSRWSAHALVAGQLVEVHSLHGHSLSLYVAPAALCSRSSAVAGSAHTAGWPLEHWLPLPQEPAPVLSLFISLAQCGAEDKTGACCLMLHCVTGGAEQGRHSEGGAAQCAGVRVVVSPGALPLAPGRPQGLRRRLQTSPSPGATESALLSGSPSATASPAVFTLSGSGSVTQTPAPSFSSSSTGTLSPSPSIAFSASSTGSALPTELVTAIASYSSSSTLLLSPSTVSSASSTVSVLPTERVTTDSSVSSSSTFTLSSWPSTSSSASSTDSAPPSERSTAAASSSASPKSSSTASLSTAFSATGTDSALSTEHFTAVASFSSSTESTSSSSSSAASSASSTDSALPTERATAVATFSSSPKSTSSPSLSIASSASRTGSALPTERATAVASLSSSPKSTSSPSLSIASSASSTDSALPTERATAVAFSSSSPKSTSSPSLSTASSAFSTHSALPSERATAIPSLSSSSVSTFSSLPSIYPSASSTDSAPSSKRATIAPSFSSKSTLLPSRSTASSASCTNSQPPSKCVTRSAPTTMSASSSASAFHPLPTLSASSSLSNAPTPTAVPSPSISSMPTFLSSPSAASSASSTYSALPSERATQDSLPSSSAFASASLTISSTGSPSSAQTSSAIPVSSSPSKSTTPSPTPIAAPADCPTCPVSISGCQCLTQCIMDFDTSGSLSPVCLVLPDVATGARVLQASDSSTPYPTAISVSYSTTATPAHTLPSALPIALPSALPSTLPSTLPSASSYATGTSRATLSPRTSVSAAASPSFSRSAARSPSLSPSATASGSDTPSPSMVPAVPTLTPLLSTPTLRSSSTTASSGSASPSPARTLRFSGSASPSTFTLPKTTPTTFSSSSAPPLTSGSSSATVSVSSSRSYHSSASARGSASPSGTSSPTASASPSSGVCSLKRLAYSNTLRGLVDACVMPFFGLTNRGCNCTTPCAVTVLSPGLACEVDPLCPSAYASSLAASGWWDYCDAPAARVAPPVLSFCDVYFFLPQCQNASVPLASDVKQLAALLTVPGSNYTFSFLDVTFAKTLGAGGVGATSAGRSAGMGTPGASFIAVDAARALMTSSLPLFSALGITSTLFALGAFVLVLRAAAAALLALCCSARAKRGTLTAARRSVTAPPPGAKSRGGKLQPSQRTFTVPLSRALEGAAGAYKGAPLVMLGSLTYSIRAQQHVYEELNLLLVLKLAHKDLLPSHLALAESDGVFGPEVPGLLFIVPYYWAERKDFVKACSALSADRGLQAEGRPVKEGYQRRLAGWVKACCQREGKALAVAGEVLDERLRSPLEWEGFDWTAVATPAATSLGARAPAATPPVTLAAAAAAAVQEVLSATLSARKRMAQRAGCLVEELDSTEPALVWEQPPLGTKRVVGRTMVREQPPPGTKRVLGRTRAPEVPGNTPRSTPLQWEGSERATAATAAASGLSPEAPAGAARMTKATAAAVAEAARQAWQRMAESPIEELDSAEPARGESRD